MITVTRRNPGPFSAHHVQLLQTFADQAVIAIENVRLFDEVQAKTRDLTEALTYQTGSANILNVIASSPTDIEPVLNAIVEGACELCEANDAAVLLKDGEHLRFRAHHGPIDINLEKWPITRGWTAGRAFLDGKPVHLRDTQSEEAKEFPDSRALSVPPYTNFSVRTVLSVPLLRESERVGAILLRRIEMRPFSDKQIALLQTFADQAVIAINNARLFDEVQAKTRDLTESLQQQTATADVLKVISRSAVRPAARARHVGRRRHVAYAEPTWAAMRSPRWFNLPCCRGLRLQSEVTRLSARQIGRTVTVARSGRTRCRRAHRPYLRCPSMTPNIPGLQRNS